MEEPNDLELVLYKAVVMFNTSFRIVFETRESSEDSPIFAASEWWSTCWYFNSGSGVVGIAYSAGGVGSW
jgi:hypothetical protein